MGQNETIKLFEEKKVRTIWNDMQEKWLLMFDGYRTFYIHTINNT